MNDYTETHQEGVISDGDTVQVPRTYNSDSIGMPSPNPIDIKNLICTRMVGLEKLMADKACSSSIVYFARRCRELSLDPGLKYTIEDKEISLIADFDMGWIHWLIEKGYLSKKINFEPGDIVRRIVKKEHDTHWLILRTPEQTRQDKNLDVFQKGTFECFDINLKKKSFVSYSLIMEPASTQKITHLGNIRDLINYDPIDIKA